MNQILSYLNDLSAYLFSWSGWWVWTLAALAIIVLLYVRPHSFWLTDLIYRFPLIGKLTRYSGDLTEHVSGGGWLNVERNLCRDYARYVKSLSREQFDNNIEYLRKAHDLGRRPMPGWALILISTLVVFEGLAFAYILGSWISIESTANERFLFMIAVVAVLAIVLVLVTHAAGHQIYRTNLLKSCFRDGKEKRSTEFFTRPVSLSEDQSVDDDKPSHVQCTNRVAARHGDFGSTLWVWVAAFLVLVIAVGSTILRLETLESSNDGELLANIFGESAAAAVGGGQSDNLAAFVSFAILAVIFIVTQIVSVSFGHKYGFGGRQSLKAFNATGGHPDYRSYWKPIQDRVDTAELRLETLHRLIERRTTPIDWSKSFLDFLREARRSGSTNLNLPPGAPDQPPSQPDTAAAAENRTGDDDNVTPFDRTAS